MRYIRITRVLNRREESYVLNRDVCYYCRATANEYFHSFTKRGSVDTRIRAIVKYNIGEFFFLLSNRTRNPIESRYPWILLHAPFLSPSKELIVRPARLRFNIIVLLRWTGIEKRRRRRWIYTVRFARALLSTRNPWRAPMESHGYAKESWYSKSYLFHYKLPTNHSLNPISTRNIANPIFINFFSPEQNQEYFEESLRYFFVQICQISITIGTSLRSFFFVTASIPAISKTFTIWTIVSYGRARR